MLSVAYIVFLLFEQFGLTSDRRFVLDDDDRGTNSTSLGRGHIDSHLKVTTAMENAPGDASYFVGECSGRSRSMLASISPCVLGKAILRRSAVVGIDPVGDLWLVDMWRKQSDSAESVDALLDLVQRYRPIVVATESGQIKSALGPWLKKRMDERRVYVATETFPTKGDKSARCREHSRRHGDARICACRGMRRGITNFEASFWVFLFTAGTTLWMPSRWWGNASFSRTAARRYHRS